MRGSEPPDRSLAPAAADIDPQVAEALVLAHLTQHYKAWLDEPVPALDGHTPRKAASEPNLRPQVELLIRGLEGDYERALKSGQPAYDPSWMWTELGFDIAEDSAYLPPLAHERVAERVPGSSEASHQAAERLREARVDAHPRSTLSVPQLDTDIALQRFLRRDRASANTTGHEGAAAAVYLPLMIHLELYRRKIFWVDAALSYMLEQTDIEVTGRELRPPFASFALVLTDRHALSLAERLLARRPDDALCGQMLRVATVYVNELETEDARKLSIVFALDALGADLPSLVTYEVPAEGEAPIQNFFDSIAIPVVIDSRVHDMSPERALLRLVINAVLYATSAGGSATERQPPAPVRSSHGGPPPPSRSSDSVFFLPGNIDIRRVRELREIQRRPDGRELFARFMVRGHWRRPNKNWTDQRLRWIAPYWKGPEIATIIERTYRLKP